MFLLSTTIHLFQARKTGEEASTSETEKVELKATEKSLRSDAKAKDEAAEAKAMDPLERLKQIENRLQRPVQPRHGLSNVPLAVSFEIFEVQF